MAFQQLRQFVTFKSQVFSCSDRSNQQVFKMSDRTAPEIEQQIADLRAQQKTLSGSANKNRRKKVGTKIKKLEQALANLQVSAEGEATTNAGSESAPSLPSPSSAPTEQPPVCPQKHTMTVSTFQEGNYKTGWHCDQCKKFGKPSTERWFCTECQHDICFNCPGPQGAKNDEDEDTSGEGEQLEEIENAEQADLLRQVDTLAAEAKGEAVTEERKKAIAAEIAALKTTLADLQRYDTLRRELDGLLSLKGEKKVAARSRIKEVEKALDELEEKHRAAEAAKLAAQTAELGKIEPPAGVTFLTMKTARRRAKVQVTDNEAWAKWQCAESTKLSKGKSTLFWDNSRGGKERKAGLGKAGKILELDRSDASAKLKFEDGSTAWFPVAALSNLSEAGEANESSKSGGSRAGGGSANKRKSKGSKRR